MFGRKAKEIEDLKQQIAQLEEELSAANDETDELSDQLASTAKTLENFDILNDETMEEKPYVQLLGVWDDQRQGFSINVNWNAPFLQRIVAVGVDGETDLEVASYGTIILAQQVIGGIAQERFEENGKIE